MHARLTDKIDALIFTHGVFEVELRNGAVITPASDEAARLLGEIQPWLAKYYGSSARVRLQEVAARLAGHPTRKGRRYRY